MNDLISYLNARIYALEEDNFLLRERDSELTTYIYELIDKDCPEDYKRVIKNEVFNKE
tara:strand:- start:141 stop:314 length:174 start_codon:yes stop_codon:yes gene_type:complete